MKCTRLKPRLGSEMWRTARKNIGRQQDNFTGPLLPSQPVCRDCGGCNSAQINRKHNIKPNRAFEYAY